MLDIDEGATRFQWSPFSALLHYRSILVRDSSGRIFHFPQGASFLFDADQRRSNLLRPATYEPEEDLPVTRWLSPSVVLQSTHDLSLFNEGGWELRYNNGELIAKDDGLGPTVISPGAKYLAYVNLDQKVILYDVETRTKRTLGPGTWSEVGWWECNDLTRTKFSPDGRFVAWNLFDRQSDRETSRQWLFLHDIANNSTIMVTNSLLRGLYPCMAEFSWPRVDSGLEFTTDFAEGGVTRLRAIDGRVVRLYKDIEDCRPAVNASSFWLDDRHLLIDRCAGLTEITLGEGAPIKRVLLQDASRASSISKNERGDRLLIVTLPSNGEGQEQLRMLRRDTGEEEILATGEKGSLEVIMVQ